MYKVWRSASCPAWGGQGPWVPLKTAVYATPTPRHCMMDSTQGWSCKAEMWMKRNKANGGTAVLKTRMRSVNGSSVDNCTFKEGFLPFKISRPPERSAVDVRKLWHRRPKRSHTTEFWLESAMVMKGALAHGQRVVAPNHSSCLEPSLRHSGCRLLSAWLLARRNVVLYECCCLRLRPPLLSDMPVAGNSAATRSWTTKNWVTLVRWFGLVADGWSNQAPNCAPGLG